MTDSIFNTIMGFGLAAMGLGAVVLGAAVVRSVVAYLRRDR